jgi:hypothetical protein
MASPLDYLQSIGIGIAHGFATLGTIGFEGITRPSARYPTWPLGSAMRPSRVKFSSTREC